MMRSSNRGVWLGHKKANWVSLASTFLPHQFSGVRDRAEPDNSNTTCYWTHIWHKCLAHVCSAATDTATKTDSAEALRSLYVKCIGLAFVLATSKCHSQLCCAWNAPMKITYKTCRHAMSRPMRFQEFCGQQPCLRHSPVLSTISYTHPLSFFLQPSVNMHMDPSGCIRTAKALYTFVFPDHRCLNVQPSP